MDKPLTVNLAATLLGFHPAYVRLLLRKGKISGTKPTGKARSSWRIDAAAIHKFLSGKQLTKFEIKQIGEKDYWEIFRDGQKISIVETKDEALAITKQLGATENNTRIL